LKIRRGAKFKGKRAGGDAGGTKGDSERLSLAHLRTGTGINNQVHRAIALMLA
jgi:hypothetical protein